MIKELYLRLVSKTALILLIFFQVATVFAHPCSGVEGLSEVLLHSPLENLVDKEPSNFLERISHSTAWHNLHDGTWIFELSLEKTWKIYTQTSASILWASQLIDLKILGDSKSEAESFSPGSRYYMDIKIGSICKLPMGFEITEIVENKLIALQYLTLSPARGKQWIYFESIAPDRTRVSHYTKFRGKNKAIDLMYPLYHKEAVRRLHQRAIEISTKFQ